MTDYELAHAYATGLCGVLAWEVHKLTQWPIIGAWAKRFDGFDHVMVIDPDGGIWDFKGEAQSEERFMAMNPHCYEIRFWEPDPHARPGIDGQYRPFGHIYSEQMYAACRTQHIRRLLPTIAATYCLAEHRNHSSRFSLRFPQCVSLW